MMKTINSSLLCLICLALPFFSSRSFFSLYFFHLPFFFFTTLFSSKMKNILLHKHRDQWTGMAFGRWKTIWRALIDLGMHRPYVSVPLCKCYFFRNRMLRHRSAPPTSAQMVIKSRSSSLIYQRLHVSSGPKPTALICCPTSEETRQYILKLFI